MSGTIAPDTGKPTAKSRRQSLEASRQWWENRVADMIQDGRADRDIKEARVKVEEFTDKIYHLDIANKLVGVSDAEQRARVLTGLAIADGSHTAAGAHERTLQQLRAEREARELAERERAEAQTDPQAAVASLTELILTLPDSVRREIADAIGATVHVHGDAPVLAVVPPLPPEPAGGAVPSTGPTRRIIGRPA